MSKLIPKIPAIVSALGVAVIGFLVKDGEISAGTGMLCASILSGVVTQVAHYLNVPAPVQS